MRFGDYIELQYYNPNAGTKGGRIFTVDIWSICFEDGDIVAQDERNNKKNSVGKLPLPFCRYCFNSNIKVPVTNGVCNRREKKHKKSGAEEIIGTRRCQR